MAFDLEKNDTKFVVAGGGTAGWLTALQIRQHFPDVDVTLIESSDIGVLGAGEGSVPQFIDILHDIRIPVSDLIKHADATIKNGVKLVDWNGRGKDDVFFSSFASIDPLDYVINTRPSYSLMSMSTLESIVNGKALGDINFNQQVCNGNKVKFVKDSRADKKSDPMSHFHQLGPYSVHFNAVKLAKYLKTVGIRRNIKVIDGIIKNINNDEEDYITSFDLEDGTNVPCHFVFDCTGFKRLIIGKHYNAEWKSYKEYLPVNKAMPFFLPLGEGSIPSYTEALAMKYGWMWKIPTQERFGCGYVYDSTLVSDEDAKKEIQEAVGREIEVTRTFSFEPGTYKTPWVKNCIAAGLSSGFVEPLEATSIHVCVISFCLFLAYIKGAVKRNEDCIKRFNQTMGYINNDTLNFLHFHYLTERTDTVFWKDFEKRTKCPDIIQDFKDNNKDPVHLLSRDCITNNLFPINLWLEIGAGVRFFNRQAVTETFESINTGSRKALYGINSKDLRARMKQAYAELEDHTAFINYIKSNK